MIPKHAQVVFERIAFETGISTREVIEEFDEPSYLLATQSVPTLERRLRYFFGLPAPRDSLPSIRSTESVRA
jgi:hypothetical protein